MSGIRRGTLAGGLCLMVVLAGSGPGRAAESDPAGQERADPWQVHGYLKSFLDVLANPALEGAGAPPAIPAQGVSMVDARLKVQWKPDPEFVLDAAYEMEPTVASGALSAAYPWLPRPNPFAYRIRDLPNVLFPQPGTPAGTFTLEQNLDRLNLTYSPGWGDITAGRQPIAFGSAKVINPTDGLTPFTFQTLDKEERSGVDAVRVKLPMGQMGETDVGFVFGQDARAENSAAFAKQKFYAWDTNVTVLLMEFRNNILAGLDLARSVGGASVWLEAAYTWAGARTGYRPEDNYFRLSAGADYNLADGLYGLAEYHFNGAGAADPADYLAATGKTAYTQGAVYLMGRNYLAPGLTYQITPLLTAGLQGLFNLGDGSVSLAPSLDYNFADNVAIDLGAFIGVGRAPETEALAPAGARLRSEFGAYPDIYFLSLKLYY